MLRARSPRVVARGISPFGAGSTAPRPPRELQPNQRHSSTAATVAVRGPWFALFSNATTHNSELSDSPARRTGNEAPGAGSSCTCESAGIAIAEQLLPIGDSRHTSRHEKRAEMSSIRVHRELASPLVSPCNARVPQIPGHPDCAGLNGRRGSGSGQTSDGGNSC